MLGKEKEYMNLVRDLVKCTLIKEKVLPHNKMLLQNGILNKLLSSKHLYYYFYQST